MEETQGQRRAPTAGQAAQDPGSVEPEQGAGTPAQPSADSGTDPAGRPKTAGERLAARRAAKAQAKAVKYTPAAPKNEPDEVTHAVTEATHWFDGHQKQFWTAFGILAVIGIVATVASVALQEQSRAAADALYEGVEVELSPVGEAPEDSDGFVTYYATAQARADKALAAYTEAAAEHGDTTAGHFAQVGKARAQLELGQATEAQAGFATVADIADAPPVLRAQALEGVGYALEAQEKYAEAADAFGKLASVDAAQYAPLGAYHRGRMLVSQGQREQAVKVLQQMLGEARSAQETGGTVRFGSAVTDAELLLTELGVTPEKPTLPAGGAAGAGGTNADLQQVLEQLRKQMADKPGAQGAATP